MDLRNPPIPPLLSSGLFLKSGTPKSTVIFLQKGFWLMEKELIDRINQLAHKSKAEGLTEEEKAEQQKLRDQYRFEFRQSLQVQLDNTYIMDENGNKHKLGK